MRRRIVLNFRNSEDQASENIDTTPLRRSTIAFPRLRLLYKDFKSDKDSQKPVVANYQVTVAKSVQQIVKKYTLKAPKKTYYEDRFIKFNYNSEAANYLLKKRNENQLQRDELDVFKQVDSLHTKWQRKFMHQLMVKENVIPGVRQKQVLRANHLSTENKLPGNLAGRPRELWDEDQFEDGMWKSKPRKRPLIGIIDSILDMPGFQTSPRPTLPMQGRLVDWGSRNIIAAAVQDIVTLYNGQNASDNTELENVEISNISALKWSKAGTKLAICTKSSQVNLYCVDSQKVIWTSPCCGKNYLPLCYARCICWPQDDRYVITGCVGVITVHSVENGNVVQYNHAHVSEILLLEFSSNYRYIASASHHSLDRNIRIFLWPYLIPYVDIDYCEPVLALAWHPYESGYLCIGGGYGNASLSLWNVNKLVPEGYRNVYFHGAVKNLAWNKHSAELVVNWSYFVQQAECTLMPVLGSLDRVVDMIMVDKDLQVNSIMWNPDHTQLAVQYNESLCMWNFFGDQYQCQKNKKKPRKVGANVRDDVKFTNFKEFEQYNIR